jgi:hypothetical protein
MEGSQPKPANPIGCGGIMSPKQQLIVIACLGLGGCAVETSEPGADAQPLAQSDSALCKNALSAAEEKTALKLIDDICGDTWCDGDNNFAFDRLTCRPAATNSSTGGSCTLKLRLIPRDDSGRSYARTCTTSGFFGFDSLVDTAENGYQSLDWDYYLALTDCITRLEAELH